MNRSGRRSLPALGVVLVVVLMAAGGFWLLGSENLPKAHQQSTTPVRMTIQHKTTITGQIVPRKKVKIKSQANGILEEVLVKPGQWVKHGDVIARIQLRPDPVEVNTTQSQINKARLEHKRAAAELKRRQHLHDQKLISDAAFQDDRLKFDVTRADLKQAERELELRMKGASSQLRTTSTIITATVDGMVLERPVEIGDFIIKTNDLNEGTTVVTIADMHDLIFKGDVEEADAGRLKEGMSLSVGIGALPEKRFTVVLEFIAPEARKTDQGRIVFELQASLPPPEPAVFLRAGYSATAEIVFARHEQVLAIPESYLVFRNHQPHVRIQKASESVVEQAVITGLSDGFYIEVTSGLEEQDLLLAPEPAGAP
jgi:HlyD family secretion protein